MHNELGATDNIERILKQEQKCVQFKNLVCKLLAKLGARLCVTNWEPLVTFRNDLETRTIYVVCLQFKGLICKLLGVRLCVTNWEPLILWKGSKTRIIS